MLWKKQGVHQIITKENPLKWGCSLSGMGDVIFWTIIILGIPFTSFKIDPVRYGIKQSCNFSARYWIKLAVVWEFSPHNPVFLPHEFVKLWNVRVIFSFVRFHIFLMRMIFLWNFTFLILILLFSVCSGSGAFYAKSSVHKFWYKRQLSLILPIY